MPSHDTAGWNEANPCAGLGLPNIPTFLVTVTDRLSFRHQTETWR
jgi:hypothetical protein